MKSRKSLLIVFAILLSFGLMTSTAYSGAHKGSSKCKYCSKSGKSGKSSKSESLEGKFYKKVHMIYVHQLELAVTEDQLDKMKSIKTKLKKDLIKKDAEVDVLKVDIKTLMWDDPIDTKSINKLIDQKYNVKEDRAKTLVAAFAELKGVLTEGQKNQFKVIWLEKMK